MEESLMEPGEKSLDGLRRALVLPDHDITDFSPLQLAYLGDAVYELMARSHVLSRIQAPVEKLHRITTGLVKAQAQAAIYHALEEELSEEEKSMFRRGRNAKSYSRAKNASLSEYRIATGFEALMGYLYLKNDRQRLLELADRGIDYLESCK